MFRPNYIVIPEARDERSESNSHIAYSQRGSTLLGLLCSDVGISRYEQFNTESLSVKSVTQQRSCTRVNAGWESLQTEPELIQRCVLCDWRADE